MTTIREVMSAPALTIDAEAPIQQAARVMRDQDIGDVIVMDDSQIAGIVTDRDIAVRAVAEGADPTTPVREVCSNEIVAVSPDDTIDHAIQLMRERALRRIPAVEDDRPVGIVTLGDMALERDPSSALADISAAPANV